MSTLPPEIISDILCRLPVKSLLRFRCTSKPWCSLIDDPQFTKLHLNHSIHTNSNHTLLLWSPRLYSVNLDSLDRAVEINHPLKTKEDKTKVIGSCNGLLCLYNSAEETVLFNMSTGKLAAVVSPTGAAADVNLLNQIAYGFGYDSVHEDYKVLRIVQFCFNPDSEVMIYGLKSNSWKRIGDFPYDLHRRRSTGVFADGALHWLVTSKEDRDDYFVVGFDLATENFQVVPGPDIVYENFFIQVGVFDGHLGLICNYVRDRTDVWVMKDYGAKESWSKLLSVAQPQVIRSFDNIKPLAYMRGRNEVLLVKDDKKILRYDLTQNKVKNVRLRGMPVPFYAVVYVESLVNPMPLATRDDGIV